MSDLTFDVPKNNYDTHQDYFNNQVLFCRPSEQVIDTFCRDIVNREFDYESLLIQCEGIIQR